jgi:hypothetical protein
MPIQKPIHLPIGTLEEVRANGMSPDLVACCHPAVKGSIRGCPFYASCQFHRKAMGGFKDRGPKNIGYYLRTSNSDGARQKEDVAPCFRFVATLQPRMLAGMDRKNRGLDHEIIQVVAQEGEKIVVREWSTVAADGGHKSKDYRMKGEIVEMTIPKFLRPGENPGISYDNKLDARAAAREQRAQQLEDLLSDQMESERERSPEAVGAGAIVDEGLVMAPADPSVALAMPVTRKPAR